MERVDQAHEKMTNGNLPRLLLGLCFPSVLAALLPPLVSVAETLVAAGIGLNACGALGIVFPIHALIQTVGFVFGTGAGSLVANALGEKDTEKARRIAFGALFFAGSLSLLIAACGLIFPSAILKFLGISAETLPFAKPYAICLFASAPLMCLCFVLSNLLRAEGKTIYAMIGLSCGNSLSVFASCLLVFRFRAGILGIGVALPIGYGFAVLFLLAPYLLKRSIVSIKPIFSKAAFGEAKSAAINGLPSLFRQGLTVVAVTLMNRAAGKYGSEAVAALAISTRIFLLCYAVPLGVGQGMVPAIGFNYSGGKMKRTKRIFALCAVVATAILPFFSIPIAIFAPTVLQWFGCGEKALSFGVPLLRAICAVLPLHGVIAVTNLLLQALKRPVAASVLAAARQGIFFLPLIFLLPRALGFTGVLLTQPIADGFTFLLSLFYAIRFLKSNEKKRPG